MDEGVEAHHRVERGRRQVQSGGVGAHEGAGGYEAARPLDLYVADVDAGDVVPGVGEKARDRYAAAAAEVEDRPRDRQASLQGNQPRGVPAIVGVVGTVVVGERVVPAPNQVALVTVAHAQDATGPRPGRMRSAHAAPPATTSAATSSVDR